MPHELRDYDTGLWVIYQGRQAEWVVRTGHDAICTKQVLQPGLQE